MPPGQQADSELAKCFNQLTGTVDESVPANVNSVKVMTILAGTSRLWPPVQGWSGSNSNPCARPIDPKSDYIEIAKQCHTILLSNIPRLDATRDDAARRFVELVDELYDRNVNLIVSSAHPARKYIYRERLAEPFKRTASRLTEMSSREYLSKPHLS